MQEFEKNRFNVLAKRGQGTKYTLFYGHMDTVPAYGYNITGKDPFKLKEIDGKLYGLGAYDMKAGISATISALRNSPINKPIKVMFVSDEEADSGAVMEVTKTDFLKDVDLVIAGEISTYMM